MMFKFQVQSLKYVDVDLREDCFSRGQFYVTFLTRKFAHVSDDIEVIQ